MYINKNFKYVLQITNKKEKDKRNPTNWLIRYDVIIILKIDLTE